MHFRPLPILTLGALVALAILIALGGWQWGRYEEKLKGPPAGPSEISLGPIAALPGKPVFLYAVTNSKPGWRVLQPVEIGTGPLAVRWWADAAYVEGPKPPTLAAAPASLQLGVVLAGHTLPAPRAGSFAPPADIAARAFYAFDPAAMAGAAGVTGMENGIVALPYVGADGRSLPNPFLINQAYLNPERHFGYALTWWGLALTLIGVYLAFHAKAGRLKLSR